MRFWFANFIHFDPKSPLKTKKKIKIRPVSVWEGARGGAVAGNA